MTVRTITPMFSLLLRCILAQLQLETLRTPYTLFDCSSEKLKCYLLQKFSHTFNLAPMHLQHFFFFLVTWGQGHCMSIKTKICMLIRMTFRIRMIFTITRMDCCTFIIMTTTDSLLSMSPFVAEYLGLSVLWIKRRLQHHSLFIVHYE